jgi:hypothetical protein
MASSKQQQHSPEGKRTRDPARRCTAPMPPKPPPPTSHNKNVGCQPRPHSGMAPALASKWTIGLVVACDDVYLVLSRRKGKRFGGQYHRKNHTRCRRPSYVATAVAPSAAVL